LDSEGLLAIEPKVESASLAEIKKLQPVLDRYGVSAVAATTFGEGIGVPAPGQTMLIAASFSAASHGSGIVVVVIVAWLASMLGNTLGYVIGRRGGRKILERFSRDHERRARYERTFERYGVGLLVVSRFIDGLRQTASLLAGGLAMPWPRFLVATAIRWPLIAAPNGSPPSAPMRRYSPWQ
jgi:membrane protein DedA with SNARE-associated domain